VLVFDWDDTLMASAVIGQGRLIPKRGEFVTETFRQAFAVLEEAVRECLCEAAKHGEVIIITNARMGWVDKSARMFMPGLVPMLKTMNVFSARDHYETLASNTGNPVDWKAAAFTLTVRELFGLPPSDSDLPLNPKLQILSFGDSHAERIAVKHAATVLGTTSKSIKFYDAPSVGLLVAQVTTLTAWLPWLVAAKTNLDVKLEKPENHSSDRLLTLGHDATEEIRRVFVLAPFMWSIASRARNVARGPSLALAARANARISP